MPILLTILLLLGSSNSHAQQGGSITVGKYGGGGAVIDARVVALVTNTGSQGVPVRFHMGEATYDGPNWIWPEGQGGRDYSYWWNAYGTADSAKFRFYGTFLPSTLSAFAEGGKATPVDTGGATTVFHYDPFNYVSYLWWRRPNPSNPFYMFPGVGSACQVHFTRSQEIIMEKQLQDGSWIVADSQKISQEMNFTATLVEGPSAGSYLAEPLVVTFNVDGTNLPKPDPSPPPPCGGASGGVKSVDLAFKMHGDNFNGFQSTLCYRLSEITADSIDPRLLSVTGLASCARIYDQSPLDTGTEHAPLQFITENEVVVVDDADKTDEKFVLKFYIRDPSWTAAPNAPLSVAGTPYSVVTIENPDSTHATHNKLRATRVFQNKTEVWDYTYTASTNEWVMSSEEGTHVETVTYSSTENPDITQELRIVKDQNGLPLSKTKSLWQNFAFGRNVIERTVDPDGKALKSTWTYYTDNTLPSYGKVHEMVEPSGQWTRYEYNNLLEVSKKVQGYLGSASTSAESQCRVFERTHDVAGAPGIATLETEKINGIVVSRRYLIEYADRVEERRCLSPSGAWNDAANLVTETRYWSDPVFKTKVKAVIRPDGTATVYSYQIDGATLSSSSQLTTVMSEGEAGVLGADVLGGMAGGSGYQALNGLPIAKGVETTSLSNKLGYAILSQTRDIESGKTVAQTTMITADLFGRPTKQQFLDGYFESSTYGCCGLESKTDRQGIITSYAELTASRSRTQSSLGITYKTQMSGLDTVQYRIGTDNTQQELSRVSYNVAGQMVATISPATGTTTLDTSIPLTGANAELTVNTVTKADQGTSITVLYPDGLTKSVTGTAVVTPVRFDYGVEADGSHWTKTIVLDTLGRVYLLPGAALWAMEPR